MILNGKEIIFKVSNRKQAASLEAALLNLEKREKEIKDGDIKSLEAVIVKFVDMFQKFFIEATGVDVLEGCEDSEEAQEVYLSFLAEINRQKKAMLAPYSSDRIK